MSITTGLKKQDFSLSSSTNQKDKISNSKSKNRVLDTLGRLSFFSFVGGLSTMNMYHERIGLKKIKAITQAPFPIKTLNISRGVAIAGAATFLGCTIWDYVQNKE